MNVDFVTAIKLFFANYVNFNGRSTRAEYWWAMLFIWLVTMILEWFSSTLSSLFSIACILPSLAILTRRFHDTGRSGWLVFWLYIAEIVGLVIAFGSLGGAILNVIADSNNLDSINQLVDIMKDHIGLFSIGMLISAAAGIFMFVVTVLPSGPDNQYGPNPYGSNKY